MQGLYDTLYADRFPLPWQMTELERYVVIALLAQMKPSVAIEVGCAQGGSLQILAAHAQTVYAIDTDPTVPTRLSQFSNVEFRVGPSHEVLPALLRELRAAQTPCPLMLIDGDHGTEAVKRDIHALLSVPPLVTTYVLFHDSFNPDCRHGLHTADWASSPYAVMVELDYVPGHFNGDESQLPRQMWSGLALAILSPEPRTTPFVMSANQALTFQRMHQISAHLPARTGQT